MTQFFILLCTHLASTILGAGVTYYAITRPLKRRKESSVPKPRVGTIIIIAALFVGLIGVSAFQNQRSSSNQARTFASRQACLDSWGKDLTRSISAITEQSKEVSKLAAVRDTALEKRDADIDAIILAVANQGANPALDTDSRFQGAIKTFVADRQGLANARSKYNQAAEALKDAREANPYRTPAQVCAR